jgi:hypothetical protein
MYRFNDDVHCILDRQLRETINPCSNFHVRVRTGCLSKLSGHISLMLLILPHPVERLRHNWIFAGSGIPPW